MAKYRRGSDKKSPLQAEPTQLVEGKVYTAGGPAYGANGGDIWFTIRDGKSIAVPKSGGY
ncbi:MAG: hypothetical protein AABN95_18105 [Acidobacteriota bacterium]